MTESFTPELLSAYLDGELSAEEHAFVDEMLRAQPSLQSQLSQLRDLSQKVQGLPRFKAPSDFRQEVIAEISRHHVDEIPPAVDVKPLSSPRQANWHSTLNWLAPVAAVCVLGFFLMQRRPQGPDELASIETAPSSQMAADLEMSPLPAASEKTVASDEMMTESVADRPLSTNLAITEKVADRSGVGANSLQFNSRTDDGIYPQVALLSPDLEEKIKEFDELPAPGQEVSIAQMRGETPVIVSFTVVDVKTTLNDVELLLKERSVVPVVESDVVPDDSKNSGYTYITFELSESELEDVLSHVEAVQAVRYLQTSEVLDTVGNELSELDTNALQSDQFAQTQAELNAAVQKPVAASGRPPESEDKKIDEPSAGGKSETRPHLQTFRFDLDESDQRFKALFMMQLPSQNAPSDGTRRAFQSGRFGGGQQLRDQPAARNPVRPSESPPSAIPAKERSEQPLTVAAPASAGTHNAEHVPPKAAIQSDANEDLQVRQPAKKLRAVLLLQEMNDSGN